MGPKKLKTSSGGVASGGGVSTDGGVSRKKELEQDSQEFWEPFSSEVIDDLELPEETKDVIDDWKLSGGIPGAPTHRARTKKMLKTKTAVRQVCADLDRLQSDRNQKLHYLNKVFFCLFFIDSH
jgi:hypothetical protein